MFFIISTIILPQLSLQASEMELSPIRSEEHLMKQIFKSENLEKANLLENNMPELWPMQKPEVW